MLADKLSLTGALVLVSCTKSKLDRSAAARDLYCSPAFRLKRAMIERDGADWVILSAMHGLVDPGYAIEPYNMTLVGMGGAARREWSSRVMRDLLPLARQHDRVVALAGKSYIEFLVAPLVAEGIETALPLKGLSQGRQLSWLTAQQ